MDGEDAFLNTLGREDHAAQSSDEEVEEDDYDPSSLLPDNNDISQSATPQASGSLQALPPQLSTIQPTSQAPSRTASRMSPTTDQPAKKPVTIGGFITEDSDDEENTSQVPEEANAGGAVHVASIKSPSQAAPGSVSQTPLPTNAQMYDPSSDTRASHVAANGTVEPVSDPPVSAPAYVGAAEGKTAEAAPSQTMKNTSQSLPSSSLSTSRPKARLPQDVVGQLEDRIADDPKGDVDAWLGLLAHYRAKSKTDEVRRVYTRFFDVFPSAVSPVPTTRVNEQGLTF